MSTSNALRRLCSCFIAIPEYLHAAEITWARQGRHSSESVGGYLEKEDGTVNRLQPAVVIHVRVRAF